MKKTSTYSILFSLVFLSISALAQRTITGSVSNAITGDELIAASVLIKGTNAGTVTDADGAFTINVPADGKILLVSYIGYKSEEIEIGDQTHL